MVLSICIPSYNRFDELRKLLNSIKKSASNEFDVYIVDNGSKEDISLIGIHDDRFHFIKRQQIVPGPVSIRTSLDYGIGDYIMLCLDKDFIDGNYINAFINQLKQHDVPCGYCCLDCQNIDGNIIINKTEIDKTIYRCGHPSGYFFKKSILEEATNIINPFDTESLFYNNPFLVDLIYAYGLTKGYEGVYNGKLITPETKEKACQTKSHTYSIENNNIYFMPNCKRKQLGILIKHLDLFDFNRKLRIKIIFRLYQKTLQECTFGYKAIMKDQDICAHHGIKCANVSNKVMLHEARNLSAYFYSIEIKKINIILKKKIVLYSEFKVLIQNIIYSVYRRIKQ